MRLGVLGFWGFGVLGSTNQESKLLWSYEAKYTNKLFEIVL